MRTAYLPTRGRQGNPVQEEGEGGPCTVMSKLNKFEHVRWGYLGTEVQCIMGNGHMGPPLNRHTDRHRRVKTLSSRYFFDGRKK